MTLNVLIADQEEPRRGFAEVTWTEPCEGGGYQSLVLTDSRLEPGTFLAPANPPRASRMLLGRFVDEGDLLYFGDRPFVVRGAPRPVVGDNGEEVIEATGADRSVIVLAPYETYEVASRVCDECDRTWEASRAWPDRRTCPTCRGVEDPNEGLGF